MKMCKLYVLYVYVNVISAFTYDQIMDRLNYIEDRLNAESKFRREDFGTLFRELGNIKTMLQASLENKTEDSAGVKIPKQTHSMLDEKLKMLLNGFKVEKTLNDRFRREIPEIQRQIQDMRTDSKQILASLDDMLTGIESLKQLAEQNHLETKEKFDHLEEGSQKIEENVLNLKKQFEITKITQTESLDNITNDVNELKEMTEFVQHAQRQSLEKINFNTNLSTSLKEKLNSGDLYCTTQDNKPEADVKKQDCNCEVSSDGNTSATLAVPKTTTVPETPVELQKSCLDLYNHGVQSSGVYEMEIKPEKYMSVFCDMKTDGGGWTVFQRRKDGSVDFYRNWDNYTKGFGELAGEFWLGNKNLNLMTDNKESHELRIEFGDHEGNQAYAKYSRFKVGPAGTNYKLEVSGYCGNAGDSLETKTEFGPHNEMEFSTIDRDNDRSSSDCAVLFKGGWWYNKCFDSNLNSLYHSQSKCEDEWKCIVWITWKDENYSLKFTEMKFR